MICGIVTLIKDELNYLEEWLIHTLSKGFDKILIYEDIDSISHKDICDRYPEVELHSILEIDSYDNLKNLFRLVPLYKYIIEQKPFDWCLFCDIDEYINGDFTDIHDIINWCGDNYYKINVLYNLATCNGHVYQPKGKIVENYTDIISDKNTINEMLNTDNMYYAQKSFIKMSEFSHWLNIPHQAITKDITSIRGDKYKYTDYKYSNINGDETPFNLHLVHYLTKSYEEFITIKLNKELANYGEYSVENPNPLARTKDLFKKINCKYYQDKDFMQLISKFNKSLNISI